MRKIEHRTRMYLLVAALVLAACAPATRERSLDASPQPPVAAVRPHVLASPFGERNDEYYWLRDDTRSKPEVLQYLRAEKAYADAVLAHTLPMQAHLFVEMIRRLKPDDATVPALDDGAWYYARFVKAEDYPIHARRKPTLDAPEQVLLDGNALAEGHEYYQLGSYAVSPDDRTLAFTEDTVGRYQYTLRLRDLASGREHPERIGNIDPLVAWANDGRTLLYVEKDPVTLLGFRVRKHVLGTDPKADPVVYEEKDRSFYLNLSRSRSDRFLWINLSSTVSTERWFADANDPELRFQVAVPRERDHEYDLTDFGERFVIHTNWQAKNFRVVEVPMAQVADRAAWKDVIAHRDDAFIDNYLVLSTHLAIAERSGALRKVRIHRWRDGAEQLLDAGEPTYSATLGDNREQQSGVLRWNYASLTTPTTVYDLDLATGERRLMKRDPVLGDFEPAQYRSELLWVDARDGAKIPVSLVYRKGFRRDGTAPLLQYGYGSYGSSAEPTFNLQRLSLLDRGFVYAIAHVRGGQELGRAWYEAGKLLNKKNTFNDFVDVTRALVAQGYAAPDKVFAMGGSAGGLLMGAVVNQCPECYRGVIALVPFVDVVTTMEDTSIPLTTNEFDEWGDPKQKAHYDYMLSYSPYDNVTRRTYPSLLVATGLWDSQVQYFEPAKWVARLRAANTGANPILFHVNLSAGHGGKPGRYERYGETALYYAFMLDQLGIDVAREEEEDAVYSRAASYVRCLRGSGTADCRPTM